MADGRQRQALADGRTLVRDGDIWAVTSPGWCWYVGDAEGCLEYLQRSGLAA